MTNYVVASSKKWFREHPKTEIYRNLSIFEISTEKELNLDLLSTINPRYIFFPHWNWKVDSAIYERYECVAFHTAPLPFGRGGSPIQNLIIRGIEKSPVCALRMTKILDGGPIYDSIEVTLDGNITQIFSKIAVCVEKLIIRICQENMEPIAQNGDVRSFSRLNYSDNELSSQYSMEQLYNRIRMVDGLDYPKAYINFGNYKIEFTDAQLDENQLSAKIKLILNKLY
jgi:methionyl-tRNA formyltransferase